VFAAKDLEPAHADKQSEPHGFLPSSGSSNLSFIPPVLTGTATPDERQPHAQGRNSSMNAVQLSGLRAASAFLFGAIRRVIAHRRHGAGESQKAARQRHRNNSNGEDIIRVQIIALILRFLASDVRQCRRGRWRAVGERIERRPF
jgi:hypothetical protein